MHTSKLKQIAANLREVASEVGDFQPESRARVSRMHGGRAYSLSFEALALFEEQIKEVLNYSNFREKFSEAFITSKFNAIFSEFLVDRNFKIEAAINDLMNDCENYSNSSIVFLALDGIRSTMCLNVGNVMIGPGDDHLVAVLLEESERYAGLTKGGEDLLDTHRKYFAPKIRAEFSNNCLAVFKVNAEPIRALERAREEARLAIDMLRFVRSFLYPPSEDIRFGLRGERPSTPRLAMILSENAMSLNPDNTGSGWPFELNERALSVIDASGIFGLSDSIRNQRLTKFDEKILQSIHWYSVAAVQDEAESAVVTLFTALESLIVRSPGASIGSSISEGVAFLLSDSRSGRLHIYRTMQKLYRKRSEISHGGRTPISQNDRITLSRYSSLVICELLTKRDQFRTDDNLSSWIEELKFGGPADV